MKLFRVILQINICLLLFCSGCKEKKLIDNDVLVDNDSIVKDRQNIILFIADDVRFDAIANIQSLKKEEGRYPWVLTPNLDRLAKNGTTFTNSFTTISLCSPSRASILSGQYPHQHGVTGNSYQFHDRNIGHELQEEGYLTGYFGKWHMGGQNGKRPGFDLSYSFVGQGTYYDMPFEINGIERKTKGWIDNVTTEYLLETLRNDIGDQNFLFIVGYKSSHNPWVQSPPDHGGIYSSDKSNITPNFNLKPPYLAELGSKIDSLSYWDNYGERDRIYFENITAIDHCIGKVVNLIDSLGLTEETTFLFTSDNGFYQGEHGLRDKRTAYEESMRVPLIVKYGGNNKQLISDKLVLNIDIASTILDVANVDAPKLDVKGESLLPIMLGQEPPWRNSFVFQYFEEKSVGPFISLQALRTEHYKLISYQDHPKWEEVYNLDNDPYEIRNLKDSTELNSVLKDLFILQKSLIGL